MRILVTGGAGFIGSALVRHLIASTEHEVLNYDKLTYAATLTSLKSVESNPRYQLVQGDICDGAKVAQTLGDFQPDIVTHLAAESHVDRSIDGPAAFIETNLVGSFTLLDKTLAYWRSLPEERKASFRFHHISTDEVFGSLGDKGFFTETTPYDPRSPYSASKAGSDHLVSAWGHTYGLPVLITNCSNTSQSIKACVDELHKHFVKLLMPDYRRGGRWWGAPWRRARVAARRTGRVPSAYGAAE